MSTLVPIQIITQFVSSEHFSHFFGQILFITTFPHFFSNFIFIPSVKTYFSYNFSDNKIYLFDSKTQELCNSCVDKYYNTLVLSQYQPNG